jgi:hypothetical protein
MTIKTTYSGIKYYIPKAKINILPYNYYAHRIQYLLYMIEVCNFYIEVGLEKQYFEKQKIKHIKEIEIYTKLYKDKQNVIRHVPSRKPLQRQTCKRIIC